MRLLSCVVAATAATLLAAAPASAEATPFPICQDVYTGSGWFGRVCTDPAHDRCLAYGGGYVWNMCVVNPVPVVVRAVAPILP